MTYLEVGLIEQLRTGFEGEIILPSDHGYENARKIWNAMIDKRPAIIARCATTSDVRVSSNASSGCAWMSRRIAVSSAWKPRMCSTGLLT